MGLLASGADILGIFGGGTGILLMVSITMNYYQILMKERSSLDGLDAAPPKEWILASVDVRCLMEYYTS